MRGRYHAPVRDRKGNARRGQAQSGRPEACIAVVLLDPGHLGPSIQWVHSYVTDNKLYCVYRAPNEDLIREHAQRGGFPCNKISQVRYTIDPTTAE